VMVGSPFACPRSILSTKGTVVVGSFRNDGRSWIRARHDAAAGERCQPLSLSQGKLVEDENESGIVLAGEPDKLVCLTRTDESSAAHRRVEALRASGRLRSRDTATLNEGGDNYDAAGSERGG